jgi:hypothetical protein
MLGEKTPLKRLEKSCRKQVTSPQQESQSLRVLRVSSLRIPSPKAWGMSMFISEVRMAKRRNLKKEKAQRNQAYARKFRKRRNQDMFSNKRRRFDGGNGGGMGAMSGGGRDKDMAAAEE